MNTNSSNNSIILAKYKKGCIFIQKLDKLFSNKIYSYSNMINTHGRHGRGKKKMRKFTYWYFTRKAYTCVNHVNVRIKYNGIECSSLWFYPFSRIKMFHFLTFMYYFIIFIKYLKLIQNKIYMLYFISSNNSDKTHFKKQ